MIKAAGRNLDFVAMVGCEGKWHQQVQKRVQHLHEKVHRQELKGIGF